MKNKKADVGGCHAQGHLKEFYRGRRFGSFEEFKSELEAYIRYWSNQRYQVRLNGMTPVKHRGHALGVAENFI